MKGSAFERECASKRESVRVRERESVRREGECASEFASERV